MPTPALKRTLSAAIDTRTERAPMQKPIVPIGASRAAGSASTKARRASRSVATMASVVPMSTPQKRFISSGSSRRARWYQGSSRWYRSWLMT